MTYTNITGVDIGNCLTGFGIHFPITILNSGNSEVLYTLDVSNKNNFNLSDSTLSVYPGGSAVFDVFYKPTITAVVQSETSDITIDSKSLEDGSADPSGIITIKATGYSLLNITGGNPRSFRAVAGFSATEGPKFDFYWKHPTGISGQNLKNYFITGYNLDLSTVSNFSPVDYKKEINIGLNTNQDPRYSTYYGFTDDDIFTSIDRNDLSSLALDTDYYARLYSWSVSNTGVAIYASGANSQTEKLSNEVVLGYSGAPLIIRIEKQPLNIYIEQNQYTSTYDLDAKILSANGGSNDLSFYSGINIFLPENSMFKSDNIDLPALKLEGSYVNFTGATTALPNNHTLINIYVPPSTVIAGRSGRGGKVKFAYNIQTNKAQGGFTWEYYNFTTSITEQVSQTNTAYSQSNNSIYDTTNGGPSLSLKLQSDNGALGVRKDLKYNIHSQIGSKIYSGGGGTKAGIHIVGGNGAASYQFLGFDSSDKQNTYMFPMFFPVNGNISQNNFYNIWSVNYRNNYGGIYKTSDVYSSFPYWGEIGLNKTIFLNRKLDLNSTKNEYLFSSVIDKAPSSLAVNFEGDQVSNYRSEFLPINTNTSNRQPGYLVNSFTDSSIKLFLYNSSSLPTDYIFRFPNNQLTSATNWTGGTLSSPSLYTLISSNAGTYNNNFESLSYNSLQLNNNEEIHIDFPSSTNVNCRNFDLFFVCAFDDISLNAGSNTIAKLFDWTLTSSPSNTLVNQITIFKLTDNQTTYTPKDNLTFDFRLLPLVNNKNETKITNFAFSGIATKDINKISKPISGSGNFRPFILNIVRSSDVYYIFVNGVLINSLNALGESSSVLTSSANLLTNLNSTTLKLTNSASFNINYFDLLSYNRVLASTERQQVLNYFANQYLKLFAGSSVTSLDLKSSSYSYRLPNIFNLAGKS